MSMYESETNKGIMTSKTGIKTPKKLKIKKLKTKYTINEEPAIIQT